MVSQLEALLGFADIRTTSFLFLLGNGDVRIVKRSMIETSMPLRM
jgi:hypothetical protein